MHLGALKSIASNHATLATEWKVIGNLLQVIGKAISRKERQEYSVLLRDVKAYAALEVSILVRLLCCAEGALGRRSTQMGIVYSMKKS